MDLKQLLELSRTVILEIEPHLLDFRLEEAEERGDGNYEVAVSYLKENINKPNSPLLAVSQNLHSYERIFKRLLFDPTLKFIKLAIYKN